MATMTAPRRAGKSARPFSCSFVSITSITVEINDTRYSVDPIDPGEFGTRAFRLAKHSGDHAVYDLVRQDDGIIACSCPDYVCRHEGNGHGLCKHGRALVELGLMPAPIAPPAVAPCCKPAGPAPCLACGAPAAVATTLAVPPPAIAPEASRAIVAAPPALESAPARIDLPELMDPWNSEAPPELWPAECDQDTWELGPGPEAEPEPEPAATLSFVGLVEHQAAVFRCLISEAGEVLARAMDELALKIRLTDSATPAEFRARVGSLDADVRAQWEAIGYDDGLEAGLRRGAGYVGPLD